MSKQVTHYTFQKCSDIKKEFPIFEVIDDDGNVIMDFSVDDQNKSFEVLFHQRIATSTVKLELLQEIINAGRDLLSSASDVGPGVPDID